MIKPLLWFLSLTVLLGVNSCSNKVEDISPQMQGHASFDVKKAQFQSLETLSSGKYSKWPQIHDQANIKLTFCLEDQGLTHKIRQQIFTIQTPFSQSQERTDNDGCLLVNDLIPFNLFGEDRHSHYPIIIKGQAPYNGEVSIPLLINPFITNNKALIDLRFDQKQTKVQSGNHLHKKNHWQLGKMAWQPMPKTKKENINTRSIQIALTPHFWRYNEKGELFKWPIVQGLFHLKLKVLQSLPGDKWEQITGTNKTIELKEGIEFFTLHLPYSLALAKGGQEQILHLSMSPLEAPKSISSQIYTAPLPHLLKTKTLNLTPAQRPIIIIGHKEQRLSKNENHDTTQNHSEFTIDQLKLSLGRLADHQLFSDANRTRMVKAQMQLNSEGLDHNLLFTPFLLIVKNSQGETIVQKEGQTSGSGHLETEIPFTYNPYQCSQYKRHTLVLIFKEGPYQGQSLQKEFAINLQNPNDLWIDLDHHDLPQEEECLHHRVSVDQTTVTPLGLNRKEFVLNPLLHLGLKKKYRLQFSPKAQGLNTYGRETLPETLQFGELELEIDVYRAKSPIRDAYRPNWRHLELLSSTKVKGQISPSGQFNEVFELPLMASETIFLGAQNIMVITMTPNQQLAPLAATQFILPFQGIRPQVVKTMILNQAPKISENESTMRFNILADKAKIPPSPWGQNGLELYVQKAKEEFEKKNIRFDHTNREALNRTKTTRNKKAHKTFYEEISVRDLNVITKENGVMPTKILRKFCRFFYGQSQNDTQEDHLVSLAFNFTPNEDFKHCFESPNQSLTLMPMQHILDLPLKKGKAKDKEYIHPQLMQFQRGSLFRGNAFFAAQGDRSAHNTGNRTTDATSLKAHFSVEGPSPYFFGVGMSRTKSYEVYTNKNHSKMKVAFNRSYTQRSTINWEYNALQLQFIAKLKSCVLIKHRDKITRAMHLCTPEESLKKTSETWYFIGDIEAKAHGPLADAPQTADESMSQIIRGQAIYDRYWKVLEKEDATVMIKEGGEIEWDDAYRPYAFDPTRTMPFENFVDHSFPGTLFIPSNDNL